ncbi:vWFA superfamily protein [Tetraselmis virus 1]|uniref:VWFA superfamily protein n=1 Tax=Tetraselmis virus 1 TaxID=2060617 RepID=A0A2P0VNM1_9VIRU|nr:vWFA superfamily protein [Tetraselmis virus 1]AUF82505.1 vWFA superfamily protein [Tetraselmis virus 1]
MNISTENGAIGNEISDPLFALFVKPDRQMNKEDFLFLFEEALTSDPELACKILFHLRDPRQGKGEKRLAQWGMVHLACTRPHTYRSNLEYFASECGFYKDLCEIYASYQSDIKPMEILKTKLSEGCPLACKWAPSEKSSYDKPDNGNQAKLLRNMLGVSWSQYRETLKIGREKAKIVEQYMCSDNWKNIDFSTVSSRAMRLYSKNAFPKHCSDEFEQWVSRVRSNASRIHSSGIHVHELLKHPITATDELQFNDIVDRIRGTGPKKIIPLIDVSGSMNLSIGSRLTAMDISISLGLLTARVSDFGCVCMTFDSEPKMVQINPEDSLEDQYSTIRSMEWGRNTNFVNALLTPLEHARINNIPQDKFPSTLVVFSDMEFDEAASFRIFSTRPRLSPHEAVKEAYRASGYRMPKILYWNIANRSGAFPVTHIDSNTIIFSGFSQELLNSFMDFNDDSLCELTPQSMMLSIVQKYKCTIVRDEDNNVI